MTKELTVAALRMAYWRKKPAPGLIHHSDRGSQYCSREYRALLAEYDMTTSMGCKGSCRDNAPMQSFFGTIKKGAGASGSLGHARLNNLSPAEFEQRYYL